MITTSPTTSITAIINLIRKLDIQSANNLYYFEVLHSVSRLQYLKSKGRIK